MVQYDVALSEAFLSRHGVNSNSTAGDTPTSGVAGFTLRYSVSPDALDCRDSELDLKRTSRGEFQVEKAAPMSFPSQGAGEGKVPDGSGATRTGPTFRGPSTRASDVECVLVYNPRSKQYELHPLDLDIRMAPAPKARAKQSAQAPAAAQALSGTKGVLRDSSAPPSGPAASLPAKRATTARLPTRKTQKKPPAKRTSQRAAVEPAAEATSLQNVSAQRFPMASTLSESENAATNSSSTNTSRSVTPSTTPVMTPSLPASYSENIAPRDGAYPASAQSSLANESDFRSHSDSDFDDLADELADELGEEDDESDVVRAPQAAVGTAARRADDDDVSSEEE